MLQARQAALASTGALSRHACSAATALQVKMLKSDSLEPKAINAFVNEVQVSQVPVDACLPSSLSNEALCACRSCTGPATQMWCYFSVSALSRGCVLSLMVLHS